MYNFTIVIPHKNIPSLLKRCLDSIPMRNDTQVIIIDDNSDASVVDFSRFPGCNRKNVEIYFTKEGKGAGYARNIGIKHALGRWLLFADADDFFNYCIDEIFNEYIDSDYDVIFFDANCVDSITYKQRNKAKHLGQYINLSAHDSYKAEMYLRYLFGEPWCKMVRRDLIEQKNIRFDEINVHNDTKFSYLTGYYANKIAIDKRALYTYTVRNGSISDAPKQVWKFYIRIEVFGHKEMFLRQNHVPVSDDRYLKALYSFLRIKDISGFKKSYKRLVEMGFSRFEIKKNLALCIAKNSILSSLYCLYYSPFFVTKFFSFIYFFSVAIPYFIKYRILGISRIV